MQIYTKITQDKKSIRNTKLLLLILILLIFKQKADWEHKEFVEI